MHDSPSSTKSKRKHSPSLSWALVSPASTFGSTAMKRESVRSRTSSEHRHWRLYSLLVLSATLLHGCGSGESSWRSSADADVDPCANVACGGHGQCSPEVNGAAGCLCDEGYTGQECAQCVNGYDKMGSICLLSAPEDEPDSAGH